MEKLPPPPILKKFNGLKGHGKVNCEIAYHIIIGMVTLFCCVIMVSQPLAFIRTFQLDPNIPQLFTHLETLKWMHVSV